MVEGCVVVVGVGLVPRVPRAERAVALALPVLVVLVLVVVREAGEGRREEEDEVEGGVSGDHVGDGGLSLAPAIGLRAGRSLAGRWL